MKPAPFAYERVTTVDEAIAMLSDASVMSRPVAGGQSLVPMLNLRLASVERLVDLTRIEKLKSVEVQTDYIRYGALLTHVAFEDRLVPDASNGLMPFVGSQIAYRAVRTRGTIGGSIALADPAADWLTTVIALEGKIELAGPQGSRTLPCADFAIGPYMTTLGDGEIIAAINVPRRPPSECWGHYKTARKTGEYAESMAIGLIDRKLEKSRLVVGAANGPPLILEASSRAVMVGKADDALASTIRTELTDSGRDFSPAKLLLHTTVALRAIRNAEES